MTEVAKCFKIGLNFNAVHDANSDSFSLKLTADKVRELQKKRISEILLLKSTDHLVDLSDFGKGDEQFRDKNDELPGEQWNQEYCVYRGLSID